MTNYEKAITILSYYRANHNKIDADQLRRNLRIVENNRVTGDSLARDLLRWGSEVAVCW